MGNFPTVKAKALITFITNMGFELFRQKGSHKFYKHPDGRTATIPDHGGKDLGVGLTRKILKDVEVSPQEFLDWYTKKKK
jgi:predicted RNA binding protein YcfA (HicA-like mRNA interferase family)